jgi:hypothetical protein
MKKKNKITTMLNAITFATAGDHETSGKLMAEGGQAEAGGTNESQKQKKETFRQRLHKHMAAIAYAEAGEFGAATELLEPSSTARTVLLVIEGALPDPAAFNYALKLSKRTKAELDILQVIESGNEHEHDYESLSQKMTEGTRNIVGMVRKLEEDEIPFKVTIRLGDVNQKLFNYARRHKDVAMVVFDSPKAKQASQENKGWSRLVDEISRQLSIPLVTVVEGTS